METYKKLCEDIIEEHVAETLEYEMKKTAMLEAGISAEDAEYQLQ